jgi:hypothetical protein
LLVQGCRQLLDTLKQRGFIIALDTGWPNGGWDAVREQVASWLPHVDHVLFNELETAALAGIENPDAAARWFLDRLPPDATLVVKRGAEGVIARRNAECIVCHARAVKVIDTIGAGDVFNAGYLFGIATGCRLAENLQLGVSTASAAISTSPRRFISQ